MAWIALLAAHPPYTWVPKVHYSVFAQGRVAARLRPNYVLWLAGAEANLNAFFSCSAGNRQGSRSFGVEDVNSVV